MQTEKSITCPTCGTLNNAEEERCQTCQRLLLIQLPSLAPSDKFKIQCHQCDSINDITARRCKQCGVILQRKSGSTYPSFNKRRRKHLPLYVWITISIALISIVLSLTNIIFQVKSSPSSNQSQVSLPNSIGVLTVSNGQQIGVNDGSFPPFDVGRPDAIYKQQAYQALKNNDTVEASTAWNNALNLESNDAEALIYKENLQIRLSEKAFTSIVIGTNFAPPFPDQNDEEILQGIYVAQHEFNLTHVISIRILIANAGNLQYITPVAQQIVSITQKQKIVAVVGWGSSSSTFNALHILTTAHIPLISSSATSDDLTNISPYFFRIVPPNSTQAILAANFARNTLKATKAVVFVDSTDVYSQNIASDFEAEFTHKGGRPVYEEVFKTGETDFTVLIHNAIQYKPDIFYFTSPLSSDVVKFENALSSSSQNSNFSVIEGDAGYTRISPSESYGRKYFTSLAFPDAWAIATGQINPFFSEYSVAFDPNQLRNPGTYGYELPSAQAILAYDAGKVIQLALQQSSSNRVPTAQDVFSKISTITGANAYQGVSGQISFGPNHDPINKAILMLNVSPEGYLHLVASGGCYVKGRCG